MILDANGSISPDGILRYRTGRMEPFVATRTTLDSISLRSRLNERI